MKFFRAVLAAALLLTFAGATTVIPMSVEELTHAAARVVEVEVGESWSAWNADHSLIYTYSRVWVGRALKGGVEPELIVQQLGGSAEGYTMKVAGVQALERGEHAMLFLRPAKANGGGTWTVVGLMQGHFRMRTAGGRILLSNGVQVKRAASRGREAVSSYAASSSAASSSAASSSAASSSAASSAATISSAPSISMEELESRVRRALEP